MDEKILIRVFNHKEHKVKTQRIRDSLNLINLTYVKVQPFQGCWILPFIFRGLTPTVTEIKPILGFLLLQVRRT